MRAGAGCLHVRQKLYAAMSAASSRPQDKAPRAPDDAAVIDALDCLRVAITVFDCDERLVFANEHFTYMFRSLPPLRGLVGRRYDELIRLEIAGGDIATLHEGVEAYVAKRRAQLFARDYGSRDIPLADGRIIEIKTRRTPSLGWIALWSDVTEARRDLERLHTTIAMSADAFAFFDRHDRLTLCNEEYAQISGVAAPSDLVGRTFSEIIAHGQNTAPPVGDAQAILEKRRDIHRQSAGAMTVKSSNGRAYLVRDRACSDNGRIVVFTDVTEHHRAELALAEQTRTLDATRKVLADTKAQSQAQENYLADLATKLDQTEASADNTKKTLLRTMSHELKTPLNAIIGFSDLLSVLADQSRRQESVALAQPNSRPHPDFGGALRTQSPTARCRAGVVDSQRSFRWHRQREDHHHRLHQCPARLDGQCR
jgi:PAS domain S-box-containing protein